MTTTQSILTTLRQTRHRGLNGVWSAWSNLGGSSITNDDLYQNVSVSTPGFMLLNRYQLPNNPFTRNRYSMVSRPTTVRITTLFSNGSNAADEYRGSCAIGDGNADIPLDYYPNITSLQNQALGKLFDRLSLTKGSAAVSVAELDKTCEMIADTAKRLAKAFSGLKRGNLLYFADALGITVSKRRAATYRHRFNARRESESNMRQFAAQTWLEYKYGWTPLISDIYTQAENLANFYEKRGGAIRVASSVVRGEKATREIIGSPGYWKNPKATIVRTKVRYLVRYTLADGTGSIVNVFGLQNPLIVAWELIPFSFVADWFLPFGDFLSQLNATAGLVFKDGTYAVNHASRSDCTVVADSPRQNAAHTETYVQEVISGGTAYQNKFEKSRTVLTSFPQPRLPEFKNPVSVSHAISGIALLQAVFHGGVKGYISR